MSGVAGLREMRRERDGNTSKGPASHRSRSIKIGASERKALRWTSTTMLTKKVGKIYPSPAAG